MIIYAAIGRATDAAVLADCCDPLLKGNAGPITSMLLEHLRDHPELVQEGELRTFVQRNDSDSNGGGGDFDFVSYFIESCAVAMGDDVVEEHYFHFLCKAGVFYTCIGDDPAAKDQKVNFAFLDHVYKEFTKLYKPNRIKSANAYALDKNFKPNMRSAMHHYNVNHDAIARDEKVQAAMIRVENITKVMGRNINLLMERGENFEAMVSKSEVMLADTQVFKKRSKVAVARMRRKNAIKWVLYVSIILAVTATVATIGLFSFCGRGLHYCRATVNDYKDRVEGGNADDSSNNNN